MELQIKPITIILDKIEHGKEENVMTLAQK